MAHAGERGRGRRDFGFEESLGRPRKRPLFWLAVVAAAITVARLAEWHADVPELTLQNALWLRPVGLLVGCALAFLPIARWRLPAIAAPAGLAVLLLIALAVPVASGLDFALDPLAGSLATGLVIVGTQQALAVLILVLSVVSYEFVEKPILGLKGRFQRATTALEGEALRTV